MWDFADAVLSRVAFPNKQRGDPHTITQDLVAKFGSKSRSRRDELIAEKVAREEREMAQCTFTPHVAYNKQYHDVKPRYQDPPPAKVATISAQTDDQVGAISNPPAPLKHAEDRITLNDIVLARLDEGAVFYDEYRSQMKQLKEYHLNLMKLRHDMRYQTT